MSKFNKTQKLKGKINRRALLFSLILSSVTIISVGIFTIAFGASMENTLNKIIDATEIPSPTAHLNQPVIDNIANWETYNDEESEFLLHYPPGWIVASSEPGNYVSLSSENLPYSRRIEIVIEDNPHQLSPQEFIRQRINNIFSNEEAVSAIQYQSVAWSNIQGTLALNLPEGLSNLRRVFVAKYGNSIVRISLLESGEIGGKVEQPKASEDVIAFMQTIATFQGSFFR